MPQNQTGNTFISFAGKNFPEYKKLYPKGLNLHPDSEQHKKLLTYILQAVRESYDVMSGRYSTWRELDHKLTSYVDLTESEKELKTKSPQKPVTIVIPQSYATREVFLTYMSSAFLESPIFRFQSAGDPNDTLGNILLESLIEHQAQKTRMGLNLHTMWSDDITYGLGGVMVNFEKTLGRKTRNGIPTEVIKYQGNRLYNLDPYNTYPDINVPVWDIEKMQYFAWCERKNFFSLTTKEQTSEEFFNIKYLEDVRSGKSNYYNGDATQSGRTDKTKMNSFRSTFMGVSRPIDVIWAYVVIIPKLLGLGSSPIPELWKIAIAADRVIISAGRLELDHGHIPIAISSMKSDGHSILNPSIVEVDYPIQHAIDWLWGSHVANVRKAVNNMLVADPSLINMNDLIDSRNGMIARLRASGWGRGLLNEAVKQLPIQDVTQNHLVDIGFLTNLSNVAMGNDDSLKGIQNRKGERVSSAEAMGTRSSALGRKEKDAKISAMQAHWEIAYQMASNTLQFMTGEQYVKVLGDYGEVLKQEYGDARLEVDRLGKVSVKVNLDALDVDYDVVIQDGSIPSGETAAVWSQLMVNAASHPELFQSLDFVKVWKHIARLLGAKNINDFMKAIPRTKIAGQEAIDKGVQAGNLVPTGELQ